MEKINPCLKCAHKAEIKLENNTELDTYRILCTQSYDCRRLYGFCTTERGLEAVSNDKEETLCGYRIACTNCKCFSGVCKTEEEAIERWNKENDFTEENISKIKEFEETFYYSIGWKGTWGDG
jgi:hypothetical protein